MIEPDPSAEENASRRFDQSESHHGSRYWRTLKTSGELNFKYPGGITLLKRLATLGD